MVDALIEVDDVRPLIADLDVVDETVGATIDAVSVFARHEAGEAGAAWDMAATTGTAVVPSIVRQIVITASARRLRHGDASYERLGEYGQGINLPSTGSVFTGYELAKLQAFRTGDNASGVLTSIRMTRPGAAEAYNSTLWMPTTNQDGSAGRPYPWSEP